MLSNIRLIIPLQIARINPLPFLFQFALFISGCCYCYCSVAQSCPTLWPHELQHARPLHHQLPEFTQTHVHRVGWCHPAISSSVDSFSSHLQSFPASGSFPVSQFFASGGQSIFSFSISPSNEYSRLISFRIDWFDLLALKSLLQHHSSKVSILWHSTFLLSISHIHTWLLEKP